MNNQQKTRGDAIAEANLYADSAQKRIKYAMAEMKKLGLSPAVYFYALFEYYRMCAKIITDLNKL
jgi:hypothetical protein